MKLLFILGILLGIQSSYQNSACYDKCYTSSGCDQDVACQTSLQHCEKVAIGSETKEFHQYEDCLQTAGQLSGKPQTFVTCGVDCAVAERISVRKNKYLNDAYAHTGESYTPMDCEKIDKKKSVYIREGNTHKMIVNYFESRCDFDITLIPKKQERYSGIPYFTWFDYHYQIDYSKFTQGVNIVNHISNLKDLISFKDGIVKTLLAFDEKKKYKMTSADFHFKTYLFDLKNSQYTSMESEFINDVNSGLWLTKDPDGSIGLGIKLFKNVDEIKTEIKKLKNSPRYRDSMKEKKYIMYSVVQSYMENPLLMHGKKMDVRSYVLIPSVKPFVVLYQNGFIRTCIEKYDTNFKQFDHSEAFKHLTNRIYQKKHPKYEQETNNLMLTPPTWEQYLKDYEGFDDAKIEKFWQSGMRTVAYTIQAAREPFVKQTGYFQLLGVDLIWDTDLNPFLIEFNTAAGLFMDLPPHHWVIPQLVQSTLDLVLSTHENMDALWDTWKHPENLDLGRWKILYNEANDYDIIKEYENTQKEDL